MRYYLMIIPLVFSAFGVLASPLTPESLHSSIVKAGADATVRTMGNNDWDRFYDAVKDGKPEWIKLIPEVTPGTDAGRAEDLAPMLALGLSKATVTVLSVLNEGEYSRLIGSEVVCSMPFIEPTRDSIYRYYDRTRAALVKVGSPGKKCLSILDASMQSINKNDSQGKIEWGEGEY